MVEFGKLWRRLLKAVSVVFSGVRSQGDTRLTCPPRRWWFASTMRHGASFCGRFTRSSTAPLLTCSKKSFLSMTIPICVSNLLQTTSGPEGRSRHLNKGSKKNQMKNVVTANFSRFVNLFGLRTYLPVIVWVVSGEEQLSHSHCAGLCLHHRPAKLPHSVLLFLSTRQHEFCPNMIGSYLCADFTQRRANRSLNRKSPFFSHFSSIKNSEFCV